MSTLNPPTPFALTRLDAAAEPAGTDGGCSTEPTNISGFGFSVACVEGACDGARRQRVADALAAWLSAERVRDSPLQRGDPAT